MLVPSNARAINSALPAQRYALAIETSCESATRRTGRWSKAHSRTTMSFVESEMAASLTIPYKCPHIMTSAQV